MSVLEMEILGKAQGSRFILDDKDDCIAFLRSTILRPVEGFPKLFLAYPVDFPKGRKQTGEKPRSGFCTMAARVKERIYHAWKS